MSTFTPPRPTVTIMESPSKRTPTTVRQGLVVSKPPEVTEAEKQTLIDNLQLEVSERARKLRAQYAVQAQGLRSRFEMRVNRIPKALRTMKIDDLLKKYVDPAALNPPARLAGMKRTSNFTHGGNKENQGSVMMPKKRVKTVQSANPILTSSKTAMLKSKTSTIRREDRINKPGGTDPNPSIIISPPHLQPTTANARNRIGNAVPGFGPVSNTYLRANSPVKTTAQGRPTIPFRGGSKQGAHEGSSLANPPSTSAPTSNPALVSGSIFDRNPSPVKRAARAPRIAAATAAARHMVRTDSNGSTSSSVTAVVRQQQRTVTADSVSSTGTVKKAPVGRGGGTTRKRVATTAASADSVSGSGSKPAAGRVLRNRRLAAA